MEDGRDRQGMFTRALQKEGGLKTELSALSEELGGRKSQAK